MLQARYTRDAPKLWLNLLLMLFKSTMAKKITVQGFNVLLRPGINYRALLRQNIE